MAITQTIWTQIPEQTVLDALHAKAAEMEAAGKTDNVPMVTLHPFNSSYELVLRSWTTVADAEEWTTFTNTYSPYSSTILPTA